MADEISYSFSLNNTQGQPAADTTAPASAAPQELYAFADCELIGINPKMMLVINRQNGHQQMLAPDVVEGLTTCTTFRTLEEHASHLANTRKELRGQEAMALQALKQLDEAGMLLRASQVAERLNQPVERTPPPTRSFIITCDRPEAVRRLLDSMLRAGNLTRQDALFLVDDSRDPANREANREAVATFNLTSARDMQYVGPEAQSRLMEGLIQAQPDCEAGIRFLIDPARWTGHKTYGRARTLCLLLSVGYRAIVMDDDTLCQAVLPPITTEGIGFSGGGGRIATFYPDRDTLMQSAIPADFDPLTGHASVLGKPLGEAIRTLTGKAVETPQLANCNAAMTNVLRADSPILVTQCGAWGDPGTGTAHWALSMDNDTIDRLASAPHGMAEALENRLSWLGAPRPQITKMASMSQVTGLDNSALLPPYFPIFRGEDQLFGAMVEAMFHHAAVVDFPWAVPHLPLEERRDRGLREPIAGAGGISLFARYLTKHIDYKDATDPGQRLRYLAQDARRMANRSDDDLLLDYRTELARGHSDQVRMLNQQFERARDLPSANWQGYLQRGMEEMQGVLLAPRSPTQMKGIQAGTTEAEVVEKFRALARGWADALEGWAAVREASVGVTRELLGDGVMAA
jgi:hypothetical protein